MDYRYEHFEREIIDEDQAFHGGHDPGQRFPAFDLPTTRGGRVRLADLVGRPHAVMLVFYT